MPVAARGLHLTGGSAVTGWGSCPRGLPGPALRRKSGGGTLFTRLSAPDAHWLLAPPPLGTARHPGGPGSLRPGQCPGDSARSGHLGRRPAVAREPVQSFPLPGLPREPAASPCPAAFGAASHWHVTPVPSQPEPEAPPRHPHGGQDEGPSVGRQPSRSPGPPGLTPFQTKKGPPAAGILEL